jgi:acetyl-CoA carboxylase carboxyltransferase component
MFDSIVDVLTQRILLILRNAYGGAYASYNNYPTAADLVLALPTTRLVIMGPVGKKFVYKSELRKLRGSIKQRLTKNIQEHTKAGMDGKNAKNDTEKEVAEWFKVAQQKQTVTNKYLQAVLLYPYFSHNKKGLRKLKPFLFKLTLRIQRILYWIPIIKKRSDFC